MTGEFASFPAKNASPWLRAQPGLGFHGVYAPLDDGENAMHLVPARNASSFGRGCSRGSDRVALRIFGIAHPLVVIDGFSGVVDHSLVANDDFSGVIDDSLIVNDDFLVVNDDFREMALRASGDGQKRPYTRSQNATKVAFSAEIPSEIGIAAPIATKCNSIFRADGRTLLAKGGVAVMRRKHAVRTRAIEAPAWRVPFARVGKNLRRMRRRLEATRRIVQMRERFAVYGSIESPQQLRVLRAEVPVDGWMTQAMTSLQRALDALVATHQADPDAPAGGELQQSVVAGFALVNDLGEEFLALNARLKELALYAMEFDQFAGVVLPPLPPESTRVRRGDASETTPIPSCRPRRRLLKAAMVIRRVTRGRAPPPFFSLTH